MKKIGLGISLGVLAVAGTVYYFRQPDPKIVARPALPALNQPSPDATPLMVQDVPPENAGQSAKQDLRFPATKQQRKTQDDLADYSRTQIDFFDRPVFVVEGVHATYNQIPGQKIIASMGGFFVYDSAVENSHPVVFSPEKNAYGYFTGEVIVTGAFEKALNLIQNKSFEVVYKNDVTEQIIFKVENLSDLSSLEELKSLPNTKVEPDLKFSRASQK